MIRTLLALLWWVFAIILFLPWLIIWSLLSRTQDLMYWSSMNAVKVGLRIVGVRVRLEGLENIPPGPCIFAANHVSYVDPLAFVPLIPRRVSVALKKELYRIPILGYGMLLAKFVSVDRESREGALDSLKTSVRYIKEGLSFAVYPEGTRSPDGRLLPFKKGAFVMAIQAGVPIVPVSISGAQNLLRKGEWAIRSGEILIRFGPAVDASQYPITKRGDLLARVHDLVAAGLPPDQEPLPSSERSPQPSQYPQ
jgi:1-acyl-sn-glycerol-3-phosphate acyltransferase